MPVGLHVNGNRIKDCIAVEQRRKDAERAARKKKWKGSRSPTPATPSPSSAPTPTSAPAPDSTPIPTTVLAAERADPLFRLRAHPQLDSLRHLVQSKPASLPSLLQVIRATDPFLWAVFNDHREACMGVLHASK
jgi:hypothetical protein